MQELGDVAKSEQDMSFLRCLLDKARELTGASIFLWWFPTEIQEVIERLLLRKPLETDVGGLLGLIMFAGIGLDNDSFFQTKVIEKAYVPKHPSHCANLLFESQQNLSALLFRITLDNVRKISFAKPNLPVLTLVCFRSVVVF